MGTFSERLRLDFLDGQRWILVQDDIPFQWSGRAIPGIVEPPHRMITDFGTIPHLVASWFPGQGWGRHGQWGPATVLHDWLYLSQRLPDGSPLKRSQADRVLWEGMVDRRVGFMRRLLIWGSVRLFGWIWWAWFRHVGPKDPLNAVMPGRAFFLGLWYGLTRR